MDTVIPRLILASSSPRRRALLTQIDLHFDVIPSDIEEQFDPALAPHQVAETLAVQKAQAVAVSQPASIVIGADTIVVDDQGVLGKPQDEDEAAQMLARLSGQVHRVVSGLALISTSPPEARRVKHAVTEVKITDLTDTQIRRYIQTGEPLDKAGAYAIQGKGALLVEWVRGCYYNVVGFPLFLFNTMLQDLLANR